LAPPDPTRVWPGRGIFACKVDVPRFKETKVFGINLSLVEKYASTVLGFIYSSVLFESRMSAMNLRTFKETFHSALEEQYAPLEREHLFYLVVEELLGLSRARAHLDQGKELRPSAFASLQTVLRRLALNEPIQYILGVTYFYGLKIEVDPAVLIPRPETEELVRWVIDEVGNAECRIIDFGTGSGCIPIALKKNLPNSEITGVDVSIEALNVAQRNADLNHCRVDFFHFDMLAQQSLGFEKYDVFVSNPPYVTKDDRKSMRPTVVEFEPHRALFVPDHDPLVFYRNIVDLAEGNLQSGGKIFFEINESFGREIRSLLMDHGYDAVEIRNDLTGRTRMAKAVKR
jgi:release factor glutamine methyltransferase